MPKTELEAAFERAQEYKPILVWSTVLGIVAAVLTPLLVLVLADTNNDVWAARVPLLGLIVLPLLAFMGGGRVAYWLLVRRGRPGARFEP